MKDLILNGAVASVSRKDTAHPGLRTAKIIYVDDKPNSNGYGIKYEDFEDIKNTIIGTPVKMRFLGSEVAGHKGSIPIGHVQNVSEAESDGTHQLIIDTVLYADDYPDEVDWLDAQFEAGKTDPTKIPGVSFEITYHNSIIENGVEWIKGLVARAATFVKTPAYGTRTALLALASDKNITAEEFMAELTNLVEAATWSSAYINSLPDSSFACVNKTGRHYPYKDADGKVNLPHLRAALSRIGDPSNEQCGKDKLVAAAKAAKIGKYAESDSPKIPDKGGNNMTEEEIKALQEQIKSLQASLDAKIKEVEEKDAKITTLEAENTTLTDTLAVKATALAEYQQKEVIETRKAALAEAGITFEIKPERFTKMAEEEFTAYVEDLKAAVASVKKDTKEDKKLLASHRARLPKFEPSANDNKSATSVSELAGRFKNISRSVMSEEDTE